MFLQSAVFIWRGCASCKNNLGICVRPLSVSFKNSEFHHVADLYSQLLPVPPPNSPSLFLHLHISQSFTLESAFYYKRQGHRDLDMVSSSLPKEVSLTLVFSFNPEGLNLPLNPKNISHSACHIMLSSDSCCSFFFFFLV